MSSKCEKKELLLFDLDGTLLTTEKVIPENTVKVLEEYREEGYVIGVSTSRSDKNSAKFLKQLKPDIVISSGGAKVTYEGEPVFTSGIDAAKAREIIRTAREICGDVNITVDTVDDLSYLNFIPPQDALTKSWGEVIQTKFKCFRKDALKICFEIFEEEQAEALVRALPEFDIIRFTDGFWYKLTKSGITKESAIQFICKYIGITPKDIVAFGDDLADIGMLKLCGKGIAMGNGQDEVKQAADEVIGSNDENGIEIYLRTKRVQRMEVLFEQAKAGKAGKKEMAVLEKYLHNGFLGDYEADEAGLLPKDMKRGVLSQDALYDLFSE